MRVNITYSVGLEDIPKEVEELLLKESRTLVAITECLDGLSMESPLEVVEKLASTREELVAVDMRLAECLSIMSGYIGVKGQLALPELSEDTDDHLETSEVTSDE